MANFLNGQTQAMKLDGKLVANYPKGYAEIWAWTSSIFIAHLSARYVKTTNYLCKYADAVSLLNPALALMQNLILLSHHK